MITAHLPAGYLTGRAIAHSGTCLWMAVIGGVLPDLDLIWFYLVDNRAFHHHHYWVHIPGFWLMLAALVLPVLQVTKPHWLHPALAFLAGIFMHLCLDTVAGGIKWLWPLSDQLYRLFDIPAQYGHWVLNFILHPVFLLELLIWGLALWAVMRPAHPSNR
ncbi:MULTISPECIES: metal-dependent hydrolase [unclassified Roseovarius]|uniref:metal-dependent hydrolase n=1 Tax=unclassified Roseovarius TaxID=2614913 RepID=UPI00273E9AC0|nr:MULTISPECIES: metal-dependent hydrolase [unclassified Roseovarius]